MRSKCVPVPVQTRTRSNAFKMRSECVQKAFGTHAQMQQNNAFMPSFQNRILDGEKRKSEACYNKSKEGEMRKNVAF